MISQLFESLFKILAITLCFTSCDGTKSYRIELSDGIKYVHNFSPLYGDNKRIQLEFSRKIGGANSVDEETQFYFIGGVTKDSNGDIYIADGGNYRVQVFDRFGNFSKTIGRKGQGPDEFEFPRDINLDEDENLYVADGFSVPGTFKVFDKSGRELRRFNTKRQSYQGFRFLSNQALIVGGVSFAIVPSENKIEDRYALYSIYDLNGVEQVSFGKPITFPVTDNGKTFLFVDGESPFEVDGEGNIIIARAARNVIEKRNGQGDLIFVVDRTLNYEYEKISYENLPNGIVRTLVSTCVRIDSKGRIWVTTITKQPDKYENFNPVKKDFAHFEIYSSEGILLQYLDLPEDLYRFRIFDDTLFIIDYDRISVSEYTIVEK